jgi:hypothetical protein
MNSIATGTTVPFHQSVMTQVTNLDLTRGDIDRAEFLKEMVATTTIPPKYLSEVQTAIRTRIDDLNGDIGENASALRSQLEDMLDVLDEQAAAYATGKFEDVDTATLLAEESASDQRAVA